jgi:RNase P/RNase MRP subunit p30
MKRYAFLTEMNFSRLKTEIEKARKKEPNLEIIFSSNDDEFNRQVLEKARIDILLLNLSKRKDFSKQRNSGLNVVFTNIAKKKNIAIGINMNEIRSENKKEKAEILARIIQNINLCKKKKVQMKFILEKEVKSTLALKSLGLSLGMPTWMTKNI